MYWQFILGSTVISAVISGIIGVYTSRRNNKLEYITKERSEWRKEIRECAEELQEISYQQTRKICDRLKLRINAFGKRVSNRYSEDSHIWEVIVEIEGGCKKKRLRQLQLVLQEYLSLLLKWDWERYKREVLGEKLRCLEYVLWSTSVAMYSAGLICNLYIYEDSWKCEAVEAIIVCLLIVTIGIVLILFVEKHIEETLLIMFVGHVVKKQKKNLNMRYCIVFFLYLFVVIAVGFGYGLCMWQVTKDFLGQISDILTLCMIVSICFGVGGLISRFTWMEEYIERYYKYASAINHIRAEFFDVK